MNYELAKELKDAGFPQGEGNYAFPDPGPNPESKLGFVYGAYVPTLEELIEAVGKGFGSVSKEDTNKWRAICRGEFSGETIYQGKGKTPTIAVARLWLALNKK